MKTEFFWARLRGNDITILERVTYKEGDHVYHAFGSERRVDITNYEIIERISSFNENPNWHPTALIESTIVGPETKIWHHAHIRDGAVVGDNCVVGRGVYIDTDVVIGKGVKIQNYACLYSGLTVEDDVFIGPHVCFTNDRNPRARNTFETTRTVVRKGASIGANSTIRCGVVINEFAMIGCGSNVTRDCEDYGLYVGNPARLVGRVDEEGVPTWF